MISEPDDRVGHAAARLADRLRHLGEERQFSDVMPLRHDVEQHQRERNQRDEHRRAPQSSDITMGDEPRRRAIALHAAPRGRRHTGAARRGVLPAHRPDEHPRDDVDDQRDDEQHQADLDERVQVEVVGASANSLARTAAIVYCGAKSDSEICGLLPITIVTAMVSPSARPKPSMIAPTMPVRA